MCDVVAALAAITEGGETLWAKNSDRPPTERQALEWAPPRLDDAPIRATHIEIAPHRSDTLAHLGSRPLWGWGLEHGVNEAGVAVGNLSVFTELDPRPFPDALTGMDLVRIGLERGPTARSAIEEMVAALDRYGQGGSGHVGSRRPYWSTFVVADARSVWVLDTSGPESCSRAVEPAWASSNRCALPDFDAAHRHPRQPVERLVEPRLEASRVLLGRRPVTRPAIVAHLRSHEGRDGYSPCMHVRGVEETTASMVVTLPSIGAPSVLCAVGSPCRSVYVPLGVGPVGPAPIAWPVARPVDRGEREMLDATEADLAAQVARCPALLTDPEWPDHAWSTAIAAGEALSHR